MEDRSEFEAARRRLLKGLPKIIADLEQLIRDQEWWNANRLDAPPVDVGRDKVYLAAARGIYRCVQEGRRIPVRLQKMWLASISDYQ